MDGPCTHPQVRPWHWKSRRRRLDLSSIARPQQGIEPVLLMLLVPSSRWRVRGDQRSVRGDQRRSFRGDQRRNCRRDHHHGGGRSGRAAGQREGRQLRLREARQRGLGVRPMLELLLLVHVLALLQHSRCRGHTATHEHHRHQEHCNSSHLYQSLGRPTLGSDRSISTGGSELSTMWRSE
jgi:hypothetical protein